MIQLNKCVELVSYDKRSYNARMYNLQNIPYYLWVQIPLSCSPQTLQIYDVKEVGQLSVPTLLDELLYREGRSSLIRVTSALLNTCIGKHIYELSFIDVLTNDVTSLYFSYIIQSDTPETPYIYMANSKECDKG